MCEAVDFFANHKKNLLRCLDRFVELSQGTLRRAGADHDSIIFLMFEKQVLAIFASQTLKHMVKC